VPAPNPDTVHLFKDCPHWKRRQKILWEEVRRDTERGKDRFKIRDLFANEKCSQAALDFLSTMDVGRPVPDPAEEDPQSDASQRKVWEREEREEESKQEAEEVGGWG